MSDSKNGYKTYRINLHMHTTDSDGKRSPEEAVDIYKSAGYDAVAITDHWRPGEERANNGMKVFAGCEYNFGGNETYGGAVYHILSLFCLRDPGVERADGPEICIQKIHAAGGLAILAHPAWSLNQPDQVEAIQGKEGFDATEIYNTVSGEKHSNRPYSGFFVDLAANRGMYYPLFSADDVHYYEGDGVSGAILVSLPSLSREALIEAIRNRDFYAVSGGKDAPYLKVTDCGDTVHIACSPVSKVDIFTNLAWAENRHIVGENITEVEYPCVIEGRPKQDRWIRVEATDKDGRVAYSNILRKS